MMTFKVSWELTPSQQPSKQATHNHLTHCAPVQHRPSDRSAPLQHQPPSSISHLPTCGDTCLQHHHCGVHSLWSTWSSMTNNPSNIHVSRSFLLFYKLSSSCNSAPPPPVSIALDYAAQALRDQPSPTQPSGYCCS